MTILRVFACSLPLTMPFVILGLIRLVWFCAGAGWTDPFGAALASILLGVPAGAGVALMIWENTK